MQNTPALPNKAPKVLVVSTKLEALALSLVIRLGIGRTPFEFTHSDKLGYRVSVPPGHSQDLALALKASGNFHMLVQEGGSSDELYIHSHGSFEEAENDRAHCTKNGSYRTTEIITLPAPVAALGELFYETAEQLASSMRTLGYFELPKPTPKRARP